MLRKTPYGWAWRCVYCGQFACSETLKGKYVCRSHGGVTARQRDLVAQDAAEQSGHQVPRPPGRPLKSGLHTRKTTVRVDQLVAEFKARKLNVDCTDEDMLYLRAYLAERKEQRPAFTRLQTPLMNLQRVLDNGLDGISGAEQRAELLAGVREVGMLLNQIGTFTAQLEKRHSNIIKMSKIRADTRVKNHAAHQVNAFMVMLERLTAILEEQLSPQDFAAFQKRIAKDMNDLPVGIVDGSNSVAR